MKRWYLKDEKKSEIVSKILAILNGLTYKEADIILSCAANELAFNALVCQGVEVHQQFEHNIKKYGDKMSKLEKVVAEKRRTEKMSVS